MKVYIGINFITHTLSKLICGCTLKCYLYITSALTVAVNTNNAQGKDPSTPGLHLRNHHCRRNRIKYDTKGDVMKIL